MSLFIWERLPSLGANAPGLPEKTRCGTNSPCVGLTTALQESLPVREVVCVADPVSTPQDVACVVVKGERALPRGSGDSSEGRGGLSWRLARPTPPTPRKPPLATASGPIVHRLPPWICTPVTKHIQLLSFGPYSAPCSPRIDVTNRKPDGMAVCLFVCWNIVNTRRYISFRHATQWVSKSIRYAIPHPHPPQCRPHLAPHNTFAIPLTRLPALYPVTSLWLTHSLTRSPNLPRRFTHSVCGVLFKSTDSLGSVPSYAIYFKLLPPPFCAFASPRRKFSLVLLFHRLDDRIRGVHACPSLKEQDMKWAVSAMAVCSFQKWGDRIRKILWLVPPAKCRARLQTQAGNLRSLPSLTLCPLGGIPNATQLLKREKLLLHPDRRAFSFQLRKFSLAFNTENIGAF